MDAIRVWAPHASSVDVRVDGIDTPLASTGDGWWTGPALAPGTDYGFVLDGSDQQLPDPRSRWQPDGVHGPSRVYDQDAFDWHDRDWRGRDLTAAVVYELHVGTFTEEGTFEAATAHLGELAAIGVTAIRSEEHTSELQSPC